MLYHIINSFLLAIGLGVDSFSISIVNGISYQESNKMKLFLQSFIFAVCQGAMPLFGYICLTYFSNKITIIETISPYISLVLLSYLGIKLLLDSFHDNYSEKTNDKITISKLFLQGIATSIDAISCSFSMISLSFFEAMIEVIIISMVTEIMCYIGLQIGKEIGNKVERYSKIIGGIILMLIGIILFIRR